MLTQEQVAQAGEAFNDALANNVISRELRDRAVRDVYSGNFAVGNTELIAVARKVRQHSQTNPAYFGALDAYIAALTATQPSAPTAPAVPATPVTPSTPVTTPAPGTSLPYGPIRKLTSAEAKAIGKIYIDAADANKCSKALASRVSGELALGVYSYFETQILPPGFVQQIKAYYYDWATQAEKAEIRKYLAIIDQRDSGNQPLSKGDSRVVVISGLSDDGTVQAPAPSSPAVLTAPGAALVPANGRRTGTVQTFQRVQQIVPRPQDVFASQSALQLSIGDAWIPGRLGIGGPPIAGDQQLTIHSPGAAEILLISDESGNDKQHPGPDGRGRTHIAVISLGGDRGVRIVQNGMWKDGVLIKINEDELLTIIALDSEGTLSVSQDDPGATQELSQLYTIHVDREQRKIGPQVHRAGWGVSAWANTNTGNMNNDSNRDREAVLIEPLAP